MNVLLIHSDQHRYDCLGANGNASIRTPALDALAASGARFTGACTPCPVCTPERASLLTGQHAFTHRSICIPNDTEVPRRFVPSAPLFPELLRAAGYRTGYSGKWHLGEDPATDTSPVPADCGFEDYFPESAYRDWRAEQNLRPMGWNLTPIEEHLGEFFCGGADPDTLPEQSRVFYTAEHAIGLLRRYAGEERPFFIRWDPSEPHIPNLVPEPYASMYAPGEIPKWGSFDDPLENKPWIQRQQRRTWMLDQWGWEKWSRCAALYYGHVSLLDSAVGRVLGALDELGLTENTLVIYTTDHGDMCGSHGMMDKHYCLYDDILRVPLIVRWPGLTRPGQMIDAPVCHALDLAATFANLAAGEVPAAYQGYSLRGLLEDGTWPRRHTLATYHGSQFGLYSSRSIRAGRWKYVWNLTDVDELYDLQGDPWEIMNRAGDVGVDGVLRKLRADLASDLEALRDPLFNVFTRSQLLGETNPPRRSAVDIL
jgi:arylsulfatase A-like enzyme